MVKKIFLLAVMLVSWVSPTVAEEFKTQEVLPGIFTMTPTSGQGPNTTFIVTGEGVIVIDTGASPAAGETLKQEIAKVTQEPVSYIINTHYHGENTFGNQAFNSNIPLITSAAGGKSLLSGSGERDRRWYEKKHPGETITAREPNLTFQSELGLKLGKYYLRLIHPPASHTSGDIYIYIASYRVIITGGLVYAGQIPDLREARVTNWIDGLQKMEDLDAETIIPGHGPVGGKPRVTLMKHYLMELRTFVKDELSDGGSLPDIQKKVREKMQKKFGSWTNQELIDQNVERAFFEYLDN